MATAAEVQALYNSIIGRTGTPDEVAWWVNRGMTAEQMAPEFMAAKQDAAQVQRAADIVQSGASQVVNPTAWNQTTGNQTAGLLGSRTTGATPEEVQSLYGSIIGRTGTPDEVAWWVNRGMTMAQMAPEFMAAKKDAATVQRAADIVQSGASQVVNPTTWADVLSGVINAAPTDAAAGGLLGNIAAPTAPAAMVTTAGGLLGGTPASTANQTVNAADITNLYKNITGSTPETEGMNYWLGKAASGMDLQTMEGEFKKAMTDPALLAKRADLIKSGASTNVINAGTGAGTGTSMPFGFTGYQSGIREVPFGGTVVGPNVVQPSAGYTAAMYAPSIQDAFLRSMQYQSQLPNMLPVFNPAATPSIYPQIAQALGRYNIAGAEVPAWLRVTTPAEASKLATPTTTTTGE